MTGERARPAVTTTSRRRQYTLAEQQTVIERHIAGESLAAIARSLEMPRASVQNIIRRTLRSDTVDLTSWRANWRTGAASE